METPSKTIILGSGGIKIAEAAEFDYSGSQALKALREEGIETIVINPNIATIQTDKALADKVYLLPLKIEFIAKVIEKERPDSIMFGFGGQSALSVGVSLKRSGILDKYSIRVLGTSISGIEKALDRGLFRSLMLTNKLPVPPSDIARSVDDAVYIADSIGYPVIVRISFNLGGRGSFIAYNRYELRERIRRAIAHSEIGLVLVEKYLDKWKEIEFEIVRDRFGNSTAVACLENIDPLGIHTGDSIVIAPCQTLDNIDYYMLREASLKVAELIDLVGECNVQLALSYKSREYYIIETNPRMSRSSALASKATGYPLAYIAAKLALGYRLYELLNNITRSTCACFEPSLDYVVMKIPRWDLEKFSMADRSIDSEMRSIGEVMAIGKNIHEVFQKAIRMLDIGLHGLSEDNTLNSKSYSDKEKISRLLTDLKIKQPYRIIHIYRAIKAGINIDEISKITGIDKFYLNIIKDIVNVENSLKYIAEKCDRSIETYNVNKSNYLDRLLSIAKIYGFSDHQIANLTNLDPSRILELRRQYRILPAIKQIDTLAAEKPARTNYLYLTYDAAASDIDNYSQNNSRRILVLGAGVFRIGVSVEFDWATVNLVRYLRDKGYIVSIINYNPETVSTDWDFSDELFFDEITIESVLNIYNYLKPQGVVVFVGGQLSNNLAGELSKNKIPILGTSSRSIDIAEDRAKFSKLIEDLGFRQPEYIVAENIKDVIDFVERIGLPVIVRPSYVLSGSSMSIAYNIDQLIDYISKATKISKDHPVVVSKFIDDAIEAEIDAVSDSKHVIGVTLEHIEPSGIHSGDSTIVSPVRKLNNAILEEMGEVAEVLARELSIRGPFNLQFLIKNTNIYVLELNLRASRTLPFSSKSRGVNLMKLAADVITGSKIDLNHDTGFYEVPYRSWAVKSPQFSWSQIKGAYPHLGPEMRSTGEVAGLGYTFEDALLKSWISVYPNNIPSTDKVILIYSYSRRDKNNLSKASRILKEIGYKIASISGLEIDDPDIIFDRDTALRYIRERRIGLIATSGYIPEYDYNIRRNSVDLNIPIVLSSDLMLELAKSLKWLFCCGELSVKELSEYY